MPTKIEKYFTWTFVVLAVFACGYFYHSSPQVFGGNADYHAPNWTTTNVTTPTTTPGLIVAAASNRQSMIIQNNSLIGVWLGPATSTLTIGSGYFLAPMSTTNNPFSIDLNRPYIGAVYGVSASSTATTSLNVNLFF